MESALKISDLTVSYPQAFKAEKIVLDNISLEVKRGDILGLLGPNGAGKTTLIKSIIGLINPKKGGITILGGASSSPKTRSKLGYMPEIANYYWFMTPREVLTMFGRMSGMGGGALKKRIADTLELVGLAKEAGDYVKNFSKGMQERLNIAQAILHDPELLILDEPFSGLDPLGRIHVRDILKRMKAAGKTILLSSHELSEAELICDTICVMQHGRILKSGSMAALLGEKGERSLENYFIKMIGNS